MKQPKRKSPKRRKPVQRSKAVTERILERMEEGESLRDICLDEKMPNLRTVLRWKRKDPEFATAYYEAQKTRADMYVDGIVKLSQKATCKDNAHAIQVQIDALKWAAGKMHPKRYGEKIDVTSDGEKITSIQYEVVKPKNATKD